MFLAAHQLPQCWVQSRKLSELLGALDVRLLLTPNVEVSWSEAECGASCELLRYNDPFAGCRASQLRALSIYPQSQRSGQVVGLNVRPWIGRIEWAPDPGERRFGRYLGSFA